jgi:hypothetical protein
LASAFVQTFFSAFLEAFFQTTLAFLRPFQGFRGFGLFIFSEAFRGFVLSIDFFLFSVKKKQMMFKQRF